MSIDLGFALAVITAEIMPAAVFLYGAYWAFTIRRALISRIYRNQSLWSGVLASALAVQTFLTYSTNAIITDAFNFYFDVLLVVLFAFLDSVIPVARRSDPLLRPVLHWDKLRYFLWADVAVLAAFNVLPGLFPSLSTGIVGFVMTELGWLVAAVLVFGLSGLAVLIEVRRSRDMVLGSSLKWLGIGMLLAIALFAVFTIETTGVIPNLTPTTYQFYYSYYALPYGIVFILIGYAFYRSARSLAPVNRIQVVNQAV